MKMYIYVEYRLYIVIYRAIYFSTENLFENVKSISNQNFHLFFHTL